MRLRALVVLIFALLPVSAMASDDYPYKTADPNGVDPWGFYFRNCTSFVAFRMNNTNGVNFTNTMNGGHWGNAENWDNNAQALGFAVNTTPAVGAIAQWNANECSGCTVGHIAWVQTVNGDGSVNVEEYNFANPYAYGTRANIHPPRFIHVNDVASCSNSTSWLFSTDGNTSGWSSANVAAQIVSGGVWTINPNNDPQLTSPLLCRAPNTMNYIRLGMKNKGGDVTGQVYFSAPGLSYSESRSRTFSNPNNGNFNWLTVRTNDLSGWSTASNIDHIRIDPVKNGVPVNGTDDVLTDYIFFRYDTTNPDPPSLTSVSPAGWTNGLFVVGLSGNDPSDRPDNQVGPDVYGSGINDFRYRVESSPDAIKTPDSFNALNGLAVATVTVSAVKQGVNVFHAYAFDRVAHAGGESTANLYFDSVPPGTPGVTSVSPSSWTAVNSFAFGWTNPGDATSGINHYDWRIGAGGPTSTTSTLTSGVQALASGASAFYVRAVDNAGNTGDWSSAATFYLDATPPSPVVGLQASPAGYSAVNNFSFSWAPASDAESGVAGYEYRVNGGSFSTTPSTSVSGLTAPAEGPNAFEVRSFDNVGNRSQWSSVGFYLNGGPPPAPVPAAAPAACSSTNSFEVSWQAVADPQGIDHYEYQLGSGTAVSTGQTSVSGLTLTGSGSVSFQVRAIDAGGESGAWGSTPLCFDGIPPTAHTEPLPTASFGDSIMVHWVGADSVSGLANFDVQYRVEAEGSWLDWKGGTVADSAQFGMGDPVSLLDGVTYYFRVRAHDAAGNVSPYAEPDGDTYTTVSLATTGVDGPLGAGRTLRLGPASPNPSQGSTAIWLELPSSGQADVRLYSVTGQLARTLATGWRESGRYLIKWDGRTQSGSRVAPGIYVCRLSSTQGDRSCKVIVTR